MLQAGFVRVYHAYTSLLARIGVVALLAFPARQGHDDMHLQYWQHIMPWTSHPYTYYTQYPVSTRVMAGEAPLS